MVIGGGALHAGPQDLAALGEMDFGDEDVVRVADFGAGMDACSIVPVPDFARIGVEFHGDLLADLDVGDVLVADLDFDDHAIQGGDFIEGLAGVDRGPLRCVPGRR